MEPVTLEDVGFDGVTDPDVKKALEQALQASAVTGGRRVGGNPRAAAAARAKAAAAAAAAKEVSKEAMTEEGNKSLAQKVATAVGLAAVPATAVVAVNRPDVLAQLAEVIAVSLSEITNLLVTSNYSDWGKAILSVGRGIGVIVGSGAGQAVQGPVVPFAIATAIMTWRARNNKMTFIQQMKADIKAGAGGVTAAAAAAADAAVKAVKPDPLEALFEITERARQIKGPEGKGAEEMKAYVKREVLLNLAVQGGPDAPGLTKMMPSQAPKDPGAPLRGIAALAAPPGMGKVTREGSKAIAEEDAQARLRRAAGEGDAPMAPPPGPALPPGPKPGDKRGREDDGAGVFPAPKKYGISDGSGRRRRKTRNGKPKRRVTRRKAPTSIKFAY